MAYSLFAANGFEPGHSGRSQIGGEQNAVGTGGRR